MKTSRITSHDISSIEKKTFVLHLVSQLFNGIALGILLLQDVILKKTLRATDFEVMMLVFLTSTAFLISIYGTEIVNRSHNRSKTIIILGFLGKLFLVLLPLTENPVYFILCISVTAYMDSALLSSWNIVFKHNYSDQNRSKYFSYATTISTIAILITATSFGYLLDLNPKIFKLFFPLSGVLGMLVYYNLSRMISYSMDDYIVNDSLSQRTTFNFKLFLDIIILPIRNVFRIIKENKAFFRFEVYFFLYGMAFLVILPSVPIYLVDTLQLTYAPISAAKGLAFHSALIMFTPLMGKYHGSKDPTKFCGYVFVILVFYPLLLLSINHIHFLNLTLSKEVMLYITYFVFGIGMSGIGISWSLSTIYFAPKNEVSNYQAVHITLTGIRGFIAPILGYAIMKIFTIEYTFMLSALLFLAGGLLMFRESRLKRSI